MFVHSTSMHLLYQLSYVTTALYMAAMWGAVEARIVDLTHVFNENSRIWPGNINFSRSVAYNRSLTNKLWVLGFDFSMHEHTGTHIDVPMHVFLGRKPLDKIPLQDLVGPLIVFDIREKAKLDKDYALTVQDILDYEDEYGKIEDGSITFLNTGGAKHFWDEETYTGTDTPSNSSTFHWPGFGGEACDFLIAKRKIKGVGTDRLNIETGNTREFPAHYSVLSNGLWGMENLNRLDDVPMRGAYVIVMPILLEGGSGGATRVMAYTNVKDLGVKDVGVKDVDVKGLRLEDLGVPGAACLTATSGIWVAVVLGLFCFALK